MLNGALRTSWRLDRIPNLEAGLFALCRLRCADLFEEETNGQVRRAMLEAHILVEDAKHFKNLHLHENRLLRRYTQDAKELKELQAKRKGQEEQAKGEQPQETAPPKVRAAVGGFEFANPSEGSREQEPSVNDSSKTPLAGAVATPNR